RRRRSCIANPVCGSRQPPAKRRGGSQRNAEKKSLCAPLDYPPSAPPRLQKPLRYVWGSSAQSTFEASVDVSSAARVCLWRAFTPFWWEGGEFVALTLPGQVSCNRYWSYRSCILSVSLMRP